MNKKEIYNLLPGEKMDFMVLNDVLGWKPIYIGETLDYWVDTNGSQRPCGCSPSTDISDAWEIVEKLLFHVGVYDNDQTITWYCSAKHDLNTAGIIQIAKTAPLAISRAALLLTLSQQAQ